MEKQVIEINGVSYPLHIGHRALIEFERVTGKPYSQAKTLEDSVRLLWLALKYGAKSALTEFPLDFESFIDFVDLHPEIMDVQKKTEQKATVNQLESMT